MKEIPLTKGKVALVDDADYAALAAHNWHLQSQGYAGRSLPRPKRGMVLMHRVIMAPPAEMYVDHINHNRLDNRRANLRIVPPTHNRWNSSKRSCNTSGFIGVYWDKRRNKWYSSLKQDGVNRHLGYFDTPEGAAHAYDDAARLAFGSLAPMNFSEKD